MQDNWGIVGWMLSSVCLWQHLFNNCQGYVMPIEYAIYVTARCTVTIYIHIEICYYSLYQPSKTLTKTHAYHSTCISENCSQTFFIFVYLDVGFSLSVVMESLVYIANIYPGYEATRYLPSTLVYHTTSIFGNGWFPLTPVHEAINPQNNVSQYLFILGLSSDTLTWNWVLANGLNENNPILYRED